MDTKLLVPPSLRPRRRHTAEFKNQAIAACMHPGVSIAAVALANQLNANMLRSWVKGYRDQQRGAKPANVSSDNGTTQESSPRSTLVPVKVQVADGQPTSGIEIEIRRQQTVFHILWPVSQATACAQWLREVLR